MNSNSVLFLSLDINKAFDSVLWTYLDTVLSKFGFSGAFIHGFKALYHNPKTRIKLPGCYSDYFSLKCGTRQGCPLSPLLFALAMEPLSRSIASDPNIKGYRKGDQEFKLSLYADDVLLFISDPLLSLPNLMSSLDSFYKLSGLSVNPSKCSALPIHLPQHLLTTLTDKFKFSWNHTSLQYLGVKLAPSLKQLFSLNYPPAFSNVKRLLNQWSSYHISFLGRIQAVKMNILPKLLFLFRSLPLYVSRSVIQKVQMDLLRFIWQNKKPRMGKVLMYRAQRRGGLGCPDLWKYFLASRLIQMAQWHIVPAPVPWLQFEQISVTPYYLPGILWSRSVSPRDITPLNNIVGQSLYLWSLYRKKFKLHSDVPLLSSFLGEPSFPPAFSSSLPYHKWIALGLVNLASLLQNASFCSYTHLQRTYDMGKSGFHQYLQIRHFYSTHMKGVVEVSKTPFELLCGEEARDRGTISVLYKYLNDHNSPQKSLAMVAWEVEMAQEVPDGDWQDMINNMHKCTRSVSIKETVLKLHTRWYYTPERLHRIYPLVSGTCFRGCQDRGTLLHTFWSCKALDTVWNKTTSLIRLLSGISLTLTCQMCLLFAALPGVPLPLQKLIHTLFSAVQWAIALNWKRPRVTWSQVISRMESIRSMERIHHTLMDSIHIFDQKWSIWTAHLLSNSLEDPSEPTADPH